MCAPPPLLWRISYHPCDRGTHIPQALPLKQDALYTHLSCLLSRMPIGRACCHRLNYPADKTPTKRLLPARSAADAGSAASSAAMRSRCCPGDHCSPLPLADVRKREPSSPLARLDEAVAARNSHSVGDTAARREGRGGCLTCVRLVV